MVEITEQDIYQRELVQSLISREITIPLKSLSFGISSEGFELICIENSLILGSC